MEVELVAYSQPVKKDGDKNPLSIAELAASVCYDSQPTENYRIVRGCKATNHVSVLEHISFTFCVTGVSRALLAQLSRHRHISLSVQSQRYVAMDNFDYVNPFSDEDADVFKDMMASIAADYYILKKYYNAANEDTYCSIYEMAKLVAEKCAGNKIKVVICEQQDVSKFGYAPVLKMNLSTEKLRNLGWQAGTNLEDMFNILIGDMKKHIEFKMI